jgi:glycosyltransferase involved in cell wall biosynthesis
VPFQIPLVSVGLPVRNGARYLREALDDLLGQSFEDWELVISDNASTDETPAIAQDYAGRDRRIRYHRNERDLGALANANWTLELAAGHYFALAAHDDRHAPDFLARSVAALEADADAVLAYGRCERIGPAGETLAYDESRRGWTGPAGEFYPGDHDLEQPLPDDPAGRFAAVLASGSVDAPMHGLFRVDVLRRIGGHCVYGSDRLLVARAALEGRFAFIDETLFSYRIHEGSTLHLDEVSRLEREAPGTRPEGRQARTLANYAGAVLHAPISPIHRARALASTARYAIGRAIHPPTTGHRSMRG